MNLMKVIVRKSSSFRVVAWERGLFINRI
jgi:hypothetical protein